MLRLLRVAIGLALCLGGIAWAVLRLIEGQTAFGMLGCCALQVAAAVFMPDELLEGD